MEKEVILKVNRNVIAPTFTIGQLIGKDGKQICTTLEDPVRKVKIKGDTCIWEGTYELGTHYPSKFSPYFYWSDKKEVLLPKDVYLRLKDKADFRPHEMIHVKNVPEFEYILIHWGNYPKDTEGCLLVGKPSKNMIVSSKETYLLFYPQYYKLIKQAQKEGRKVYIQYINSGK